MRSVAVNRGYSYRTIDLRYRAISVANFSTMLGAYISAGKYYEFGASVRDGVRLLRNYYTDVMAQCPDSKWVLAGYSQGAMVVAEAAQSFIAKDVIYIGLFGDPQLRLPEGKGLWPDACRGKNLSEYRVYVPTCQTDDGVLGERNPYQYGELRGKYGLWCAKDDYICGSSKNPLRTNGHYTYADVGIAWMSEIVALRLPKKTLANKRGVSMASDSIIIHATLPLTDYYVDVGELVEFDASRSFAIGDEVSSYE